MKCTAPSARSLVCAGLVLILVFLTGCIVPTAPAVSNTPTGVATLPAPTAEMVTATATVAATTPATATQAATQTAASAPSATATAQAASPTPASSAGVITAQNAASLTPTALTLPDWPSQLYWPGPNATLPAGLTGAALVARVGDALYPVKLDPPALGQPVPLPVKGDQVFFAPDLSSAVSLGQNAPTTLFDLTGKVLKQLGGPGGYGASYSPDGKLLAVTSTQQLAATIFEVPSGKQVTELTGWQTAAPVYFVGILPGGQTVYWTARASFQFQDIASGKLGARLSYQDFITATAFTPDGQHMLQVVPGVLHVYHVPDLNETAQLAISQPVSGLSVSPDGHLLAAGYGAGIKFFDLGANGASLLPAAGLTGPNDFSGQVSFSPDGRYLVSVHTGNILNIWKVK